MNCPVEAGKVFSLSNLLPYKEGQINQQLLVNNESVRLALMSFDEGCALSEHTAPGQAFVFALEGKGVIGYEGTEYPIQAGENFQFAKDAKHWVKADGKFKMALLLIFE